MRFLLASVLVLTVVSPGYAANRAVWRPGTATWYAESGFPGSSLTKIQWGSKAAGDVPFLADVDDDGIADPIVWRASTGVWYMLLSSTSYSPTAAKSVQYGSKALGDVPLIGDLDGDGLADLIVWRATNGSFYWLTSSSHYTVQDGRQWGIPQAGDMPIIGDFDGDGRSDLAVWRATTGWWYWLTSSSNFSPTVAGSHSSVTPAPGDVPMTADVDRDGRDDLIVWHGSTGVWSWRTSSSGYSTTATRQWGNQAYGDRSIIGDFDGDGRVDFTVFRDPTGVWYSLTAASGYSYSYALELAYGGSGDVPLVAKRFRNTATYVAPTAPSPAPSPTTSTGGVALRVLQWNTHHGGFGTDGVYDPNRLATWAASFKPDVVLFNEIEKNDYWGNQDQPEVYRNLLQQKTGKTWYYVFAQEFGQWSSNGKGNLILSTYPISAAQRYELVHNADRSIAMARIAVNGRNITLMSTHLDPYDATLRLTQATEVTNWAAPQPENRIIAGDMNAWPDQSSIAHYDSLYYDSWAIAASKGTAVAFPGNNGETKSGRIDYIFYSKSSSNLSVSSSQVYDTRDASGVTPSDHRPVLTTFVVK